jgi:hypothetical protein
VPGIDIDIRAHNRAAIETHHMAYKREHWNGGSSNSKEMAY